MRLLPPFEHLRGHVEGATGECRCEIGTVAESEVAELEVVLAGPRCVEDVLWLHVPVDQPFLCQAVEGLEHLVEDGVAQIFDGHGDASLDQGIQSPLFEPHKYLNLWSVPALGGNVLHDMRLILTLERGREPGRGNFLLTWVSLESVSTSRFSTANRFVLSDVPLGRCRILTAMTVPVSRLTAFRTTPNCPEPSVFPSIVYLIWGCRGPAVCGLVSLGDGMTVSVSSIV